jgi:hypothetical protein
MNPFRKLFRRKLVTPQEGRAILERAIKQTLQSGLNGFLIAEVSQGEYGQIALAVNGDNFGSGLGKALTALLRRPEMRDSVMTALVTALRESGIGTEVQILPPDGVDDCECSICTARRAMEGIRQTTITTH